MTKFKGRKGLRQSNNNSQRFRSNNGLSPTQPLNMFFNRPRNYASIPSLQLNSESEILPTSNYNNNIPTSNIVQIDYDTDIDFLNRSNTSSNYTTPSMNSPSNTLINALKSNAIEADVCFPQKEDLKCGDNIDYKVLDEWIKDQHDKTNNLYNGIDGFYKTTLKNNTKNRYEQYYEDYAKYTMGHKYDENHRVSFYSVTEPSTIHAKNLAEVPENDHTFSEMLQKGCFWLDIMCPTDLEMKILAKTFHIHPLTTEDITMEEPREKCEVFNNYYFICFRSFDQDHMSVNYLQPLGLYMLIFKHGILTFHFRHLPHIHNVRRRIKQLKDYINVTPDWICYGLLDDITDSFAPLIRGIEFEVDSIDELVLILKESEQSDMLRRIGYCRKRMMSLLRLLSTKVDVVKTIIKRGQVYTNNNEPSKLPTIRSEVGIYLGDVQDHLITMLQSLNHYEKISSRSHSNYLAQISIEMTQTNNEINDILSKMTALGSILVPMNLITGLFGMNVLVPGQLQEVNSRNENTSNYYGIKSR
ncbi:unnamed protein product [Cunninghamella blakesleeana]